MGVFIWPVEWVWFVIVVAAAVAVAVGEFVMRSPGRDTHELE